MAWAVKRDNRHVLVTVPIQSPLGCELLIDVSPSERLRWAHVVRDDGCRRSGGAAAADVLSVLGPTRLLGRLADSLPRTTALLYGVVAARRNSFGKLVGREARRRAHDQLPATSATTSAELEVRSSSRVDGSAARQ
jgi:predicted DCC family thiol-disulfide oxidoreductase YuxK